MKKGMNYHFVYCFGSRNGVGLVEFFVVTA